MADTGPVRTILSVPPYWGCPGAGVVVAGGAAVEGLVMVGAVDEVPGATADGVGAVVVDAVVVAGAVIVGEIVEALEHPTRTIIVVKRTARGIKYFFISYL